MPRPWWKVLVFSESAGAELLRLSDGDAVSVQGALRVETYDKDGETKISLTCIADAILPLRAAPKERKAEVTNAGRPKSKDEFRSSERSSGRSEKPLPTVRALRATAATAPTGSAMKSHFEVM